MTEFVLQRNISHDRGLEGFSRPLSVESIEFEGNTYQVTLADDLCAIETIKNEWIDLQHKSRGFDYFQSFDWCHAWVKTHCVHDNSIHQPRVYRLSANGNTICILPLMIEDKNGFKNLRMISEPLGQYSNMVADPDAFDPALAEQFLIHIQRNENVDTVLFSQYPEGSFLDQMVSNRGFQEPVEMEASIAVLDTYENWDAFQEKCLSNKIRKERRRRLKKFNAQGTVDYKVVLGGTPEYDALITEALVMKAEWLKETGRRSDQLLSKETECFLKALKGQVENKDLPPQGAVAHVLTVDGKSVAIELGMCLDRHYYCYLGAFDYSWRKFSVGKIQMEMAQKWGMEVGVANFDFLGDPSDYKVNWTQEKHELKSRYIPLTAKGFLYVVIWRAYFRPLVKSTYAAMGTDWRKKLGFLINFAERMRSGKTATVPVDRS